jgi:hypothetical protein
LRQTPFVPFVLVSIVFSLNLIYAESLGERVTLCFT